MKSLLTAVCILFLSLLCLDVFAQSDPSVPQQDEDSFNLFLLVLAIAFFSVLTGAVVVGSILVILFLLTVLGLVTAGILSAGFMVGLYRRSLAAGFNTVLALVCGLAGIGAGAGSFLLINRIFNIHLTSATAALAGAGSGLLGGLLLSMVLAAIIRIFMNYCRQRLSF